MRVLLDTHIALWLVDGRLSGDARRTIDAAADVFVSAVSAWEMAIKISTGRLRVDLDYLLLEFQRLGLQRLMVTWGHALAVRKLPLHHSDPFDRMLVAQSQVEPLYLITHDRMLKQYSDLVITV